MNTPIVQDNAPITLVGGGDVDGGVLERCLAIAPRLMAADGGADRLLDLGYVPERVVGDLDSVSPEARKQLSAKQFHHISEQDTTDFEKAISVLDTPLVLAVGFLGARLDHQLAALNVLLKPMRSQPILVSAHEVVVHLSGTSSLDLRAGEIVSLFPMRPVQARSTGLEWPVDGLNFSPSGQIGTSNRALGAVTIEVAGPGMLAMLPCRILPELVQHLVSRNSR